MILPKPLSKDSPLTLAAVRDDSRRGGVRVVRVAVVTDWPELEAAAVEELSTRTPHVLPYARLCKRPKSMRRRLAGLITFHAAQAEAQSAVNTMAGKVGAA